jgi:hypothetical protein
MFIITRFGIEVIFQSHFFQKYGDLFTIITRFGIEVIFQSHFFQKYGDLFTIITRTLGEARTGARFT